MTESEKRVALWGSRFLALFLALVIVGGGYPWSAPVWLAAMVLCAVRGRLWDAEQKESPNDSSAE